MSEPHPDLFNLNRTNSLRNIDSHLYLDSDQKLTESFQEIDQHLDDARQGGKEERDCGKGDCCNDNNLCSCSLSRLSLLFDYPLCSFLHYCDKSIKYDYFSQNL